MINLHVGGAGINLGARFWSDLGAEHRVDGAGNYVGDHERDLRRAGAFYHEQSTGQQCPRALFVDLDPASRPAVSPHLFALDAGVFGRHTTGNNFAAGRLTEGPEIIDACMERIRGLVEQCDQLEGFLMMHSLGGGTGSGFGSLLLQSLADFYRSSVRTTFSLLPSHSTSCIVEPYNEVLAIHALHESATMMVPLDNRALLGLSKISNSASGLLDYSDMNAVLSRAMSNLTASLRFPGTLNTSIRKMVTNLVPFPRLNLCTPALAPLDADARLSTQALVGQLFDPCSSLMGMSWKRGRFLSAYVSFRGFLSPSEAAHECQAAKQSQSFLEWIPDSFHVSHLNDNSGAHVSATILANSTAIMGPLSSQLERFSKMLRRDAFLHNFLAEGMEKSDFYAASETLRSIHDEYQQVHESDAVDILPSSRSTLDEEAGGGDEAIHVALADDADTF